MRDSKLIKVLSILESKEIDRLSLFIQFSFFTKGKQPRRVSRLLEYILRLYPSFDQTELEKEKIFAAIYPKRQFNKGSLSKLTTDAIKLVYQFIVVVLMENAPIMSYWGRLTQFFLDRKFDKGFLYAQEEWRKVQAKLPYKEQKYFYEQFQLEVEKMKGAFRTNEKKNDLNLPEVIHNLDVFYVISKMEYCSYILSQANHTKLDFKQSKNLLHEVLQIAKEQYLHIPTVSAYYHVFPLLTRESKASMKDYMMLREKLAEHRGEISKGTLRTIHSYMRNFLVYCYNQGDSSRLKDLFELFKDQVELRTIYQDDYHILESTLQSAITVAIKLGEIQWAKEFLIAHENRINGADEGKGVFEFNLANLYFYEGDYDRSLDIILKYNFKEVFYKLAARRLEIMLYYEIKIDFDVFGARLDAFKSFIHELKKNLPKDKFSPNNNFIKLLFQVFTILKKNVKRNYSVQEIHKDKIHGLMTKLEKEEQMAEKEWLQKTLQRLYST